VGRRDASKQEIVLGIGGCVCASIGSHAGGLSPQRGHAAFAVLERLRRLEEVHKKSFDLAMTIRRAGNLFTTTYRVSAGFDRLMVHSRTLKPGIEAVEAGTHGGMRSEQISGAGDSHGKIK